MAKLGLLGLCIPSRHGGFDFDYISLGLACEELEYGDTSLRVLLSMHLALHGLALLSWGSEEQKERWLKPQARGEKIATFGLTEPDAGSDVVGIRATARRDGAHYILNGEKTWISLADVADHFLVFAWTDPDKREQRDHRGLSAFLVERSMEGFSSGTHHQKWGIRAGEYRLLQSAGCAGARRQPAGQGGRRVQDRHVRPGAGTLHGGGRGYRADSGPAWTPAGSTPWGGAPSRCPSPATSWSRR